MSTFKTLACSLAAAISMVPSAWAAWPEDRPVEIVVGFAAGGGTDLMARKLAPFIQKHLGGKGQFVVINKPGASGEVANAFVAKSKPDGYTLGIVNVPAFLYVPMVRQSQYQTGDFQLIARIVDDPTVLVTRPESKFDSLKQVIDAAAKEPGSLSVGHNGEGSNGDLMLKLLQKNTGAQLNPIVYKGTGPQKTDVVGGHITFGTVSAGEVPELHKGGKGTLKVVAQFTAKRSAALPNVPTATESGVQVLMSSERGMAAPKGVDPAIAKRLEQAIGDALKDPEFLAAASSDAPVLAFLPGAQWTQSLNTDTAELQKMISTTPR